MNKEQRVILERYKGSYKRDLYDCYTQYSRAKINAYESCIRLMDSYDGYDFRIISYNSHMFTAGFRFKDSGLREWFMYMTKTRREKFLIEEVKEA